MPEAGSPVEKKYTVGIFSSTIFGVEKSREKMVKKMTKIKNIDWKRLMKRIHLNRALCILVFFTFVHTEILSYHLLSVFSWPSVPKSDPATSIRLKVDQISGKIYRLWLVKKKSFSKVRKVLKS